MWNEGKNQHKPGQPFQVDLHTGPESRYIPWSKHKNFRKTSYSMGHFNINEDKYNWSSLLGKRNARDRARRISQIVPKKNGPCLTKTLRWKIAKLRMRTEMEEQFYTTLFHFIITWCNNTNKYNWSSLAHLCWKEHIPSIYICSWTKKNLNRTLAIDAPFQTFAVGLLVEFPRWLN